MKKETQDLLWATLPKDARDEIKREYSKTSQLSHKEQYELGILHTFENTFGLHNLTSTAEPEEMPTIERKRVQEAYKHHLKLAKDADSQCHEGIIYILGELFGDKCLPDKEQPTPRFKVGDKVYQTSGHDRLDEYTVRKVYTDERGIVYDIQGLISIIGVEESDLCRTDQNPYTKPEEEHRNNSKIVANCDNPNTNQLKDNMEEKELDLTQLLKGCEEETLFSRAYGELRLNEIVRDDRPNAQEIKLYTPELIDALNSLLIWCLENNHIKTEER